MKTQRGYHLIRVDSHEIKTLEDVRPEIEVITPDYINEAYERVLASDVRYRFVIDTSSLRG